uniref:Uncharacterized protein n=1 Tax=Oncorhynchus kisutch TaxID=8019 RepID=A0A8C7J9K5_ONCKI
MSQTTTDLTSYCLRRFCFMSPYLTCFLSSDRMSLGCAVSESRVTSTVERNTHFIRINITIWGTAFYCSLHYSFFSHSLNQLHEE